MNGPEEWDGHDPDDRHGPEDSHGPDGSHTPYDRHDPHDPGAPQGPGPGTDGASRSGGRPRIPSPRTAAEDNGTLPDATPQTTEPYARELPAPEPERPAPEPPTAPTSAPAPAPPPHRVLKSLLGAWALAACSAEETAAVEDHLTDCAPCADEALRLRDAVGLLHPADPLDLDPLLRSRVLEGCLGRRPARIPVPEWAAPYDAETAKLDALLSDMGQAE